MSGTSNVGGRGVYEAGDQRNAPDSEINERERYKEGKENSHKANDSSTWSSEETECSCILLTCIRGREIHCKQISKSGEGI